MSKILIADDVADMRSLLGSLVESLGYQYELASSGSEVLMFVQADTDIS